MQINDLKELEQESIQRKIPIIGSEKGQWLLGFIQKNKPQTILELGTANGYSGCILGSEGAELTTIELNDKIAEGAMQNFSMHNINANIIMGDATEIINDLTKKFDLIFIDFSKKNYIKVLEKAIQLTNKWIIADNITMENCKDFKEAVLNHPKLQTEIIDIKDGLSCSTKL